ncbi:hexon protein [Mastadenovirus eidoli]|uniref:Hexon protein n=1 Tax=Eidolon helvum adenovirus TaxID=2039267 RepID=A0A348FKG8_9ADEN|nr:hexon protein [Eidolon helvum adenovirus]BBF72835.1 hexon protein [Eidolon helvum adenovirus]
MATPSMMPQWAYMHIAGQDASEYLSPGLVQFAQATESYFDLGNKFRNPMVAPTHDVTTDRSQRLQLKIVPVDKEDSAYFHKVRFNLAVGDNRVLDMASCYFDIRGIVDRGHSFKPYSGTAFNCLAPKGASNNTEYASDDASYNKTYAQAAFVGAIENGEVVMRKDAKGQSVKAVGTYEPAPQLGPQSWTDELKAPQVAGRALKASTPRKPCYGSYAPPKNIQGGQGMGDIVKTYFKKGNTTGNPDTVLYTEDVALDTPDTHLIYKVPANQQDKMPGLSQQACANRPNYIGFRDNFIGLMYYNSSGNLGLLAGQSSQLNAIVDLQDRNTELSFQLLLANTTDRHRYFTMWNQAVDVYDPDVRVIENNGVEDEMPNYCFPLSGMSVQSAYAVTAGGQDFQVGSKKVGVVDIGYGNVNCYEINLNANLWRSFLYSNIALYFPDDKKIEPPNVDIPTDKNSYAYMNALVPPSGALDAYINIGSRWSIDFMDNVNPFNHHRNTGLRYRSQILGNGRVCEFHIQVPQKFFAVKNLLLLPGTYTYEWSFRKDVNMVLQSTLGNDLRVDGASIQFTSINLYASFFPMHHNTASTLEAMLRNDTNDQTFNDYLSAAGMIYPIPATATQIPISIPSRNWAGFRGWSFTRLKAKETPALGSPYDPYFRYSGTIPYLDGTFYLNHTFRRLQIMFDSSVSWPGNDRLLNPNEFEIKRTVDGEGYTTCQSTITKDWFMVQMLAHYNIGYQGFHLPEEYKDRSFSFLRNFNPMCRQVVDTEKYKEYFDVPLGQRHNNSGFAGFGVGPQLRSGHPYPANWPYPLIGENAVPMKTEKKFLCDRTLWRVPFSSNFMYMGTLTDLGQNLLYANAAHSLDCTFEVESMNEPTLLYVLFEVFDVCRIHQPHRGVIETVYLRTPFAAGNATT